MRAPSVSVSVAVAWAYDNIGYSTVLETLRGSSAKRGVKSGMRGNTNADADAMQCWVGGGNTRVLVNKA